MWDESQTLESSSYCGFVANERPFAVSVLFVKEVHASTAITPIPGAPRAVLGYVNLRGNLYLVLTPHDLLTGEPRWASNPGTLIVFNPRAGESFALEVDRVTDILDIPTDLIDRTKWEGTRSVGPGRNFEQVVTGHAKLEKELVTLVNPVEILRVCLEENGGRANNVQDIRIHPKPR